MISVIVPVYRDAANATALVEVLLHQRLPADCPLEIIVVDDGSGNASDPALRRLQSGCVRVLTLPRNEGRSRARNAGVAHARGGLLVFIDCDCRPVGPDFLLAHIHLLRTGCIASCGPVTGDGHGFWSRYQDDASSRRARQHAQGIAYSGSTQNFSVHAHAFAQCGGFDDRYRTYGFEDRDLLVRLSESGTIGWCAEAKVRHLDRLTLSGVVAKLQLAAGESAILFSNDHPEAYRQLGYAALDARLHPALRIICMVFAPLLVLAPRLDWALRGRRLPYTVAKAMVKLLAALAFASGSAKRNPRP